MKQTAVEWLEQEIKKLNIKVNGAIQVSAIRILEQAKELEKQQIENAFENGMNAVNIHNLEQYYNETFNQ